MATKEELHAKIDELQATLVVKNAKIDDLVEDKERLQLRIEELHQRVEVLEASTTADRDIEKLIRDRNVWRERCERLEVALRNKVEKIKELRG